MLLFWDSFTFPPTLHCFFVYIPSLQFGQRSSSSIPYKAHLTSRCYTVDCNMSRVNWVSVDISYKIYDAWCNDKILWRIKTEILTMHATTMPATRVEKSIYVRVLWNHCKDRDSATFPNHRYRQQDTNTSLPFYSSAPNTHVALPHLLQSTLLHITST